MKVIKDGYKKTELGWVPEEWELQELNSLISKGYIIEILDGNHGSLYPRNEEFINSGVSYISANSIERNKVNFDKAKYLSRERADLFRKGVAKSGDILFAHNATVGPVALLETSEDKVILSTSLTYYRVNKNFINNKYLMYYMASDMFRHQYERRMGQTTRNQVPITVQKELTHIIPSIKEQQKIAKILSTVDSQIDDTDKLIEKTKELKKGLMQQLLTKGIGHTEFKKTEIGEIPVEWDIIKLHECSEFIKDGTHNPPKRIEEGIPLLSAENIFNGKINYGLHEKCISVDDYNEMHKKYKIEVGDVLMTIVGTIGRVAVVKEKKDFSVQRSVAIIRVNNKIHHDYLRFFLESNTCKKELDKRSNSTAQAGLYLGELNKILIKLPRAEEQIEIVNILSTIDVEIQEYENKKAKLEELKKGLMQQLLTGKVRVI